MDQPNFCLLVFMISMQCCFMIGLALSNTNLITDKSVLLALKSSITKDPHSHLANWSNSSSPCSWVGVTCDTHHERISKLNLSGMGLEGTIPPQLGNLSFLIHLDLSNNSFHGQLPNELVQLCRLKLLNLGNNGFIGEVPAWIGLFQELQNLTLQNNSFGGLIPSSISNLSKLMSLDMNRNFIQGSIPIEIGQLFQLRVLRISRNNLSGIIPSTIYNISSLEVLHLSYNSLSGDIPKEIMYLLKLKFIYLSFNQLSGFITKGIGNLTMLEELYLSNNNLEGPIPNEIGDLNKLDALSLGFNKLSHSIPLNIFNMSTLKELSLQRNSLSGTLPWDLGCGLAYLEEFYLYDNQLSGKIPESIGNASKLIKIDLARNKFKGIIPNTVGNLRDLMIFIVDTNYLTTDPGEVDILTSLGNCKSLQVLGLSMNPLHTRLSKSIGNLSYSIQKFVAESCGLYGNIPLEIGNLSTLFQLSLGQNYLNGLIPSTISRLRSLQYLRIDENALQGSIVDKLCELRELTELYLNNNKFSGALPTCLGNLTLLRYLYLGSNKLDSEIPYSLWNLKDILVVNISSNTLYGKLPPTIGNLRALILLDLSRNHISGTLPTTLTSLLTLQTLSLANNKLEGSIPESFGNLVSLEFLDFSQNYLSGMIPKSLESLVGLKYINLSFNRLQGEIPSGGPFANFTAQSFMHNKALCGKPRLHVPPCRKKEKQRSIVKLLLIKFILPLIVSSILVVSCGIFLLRYKRKIGGDSNERDLSLGAPRKISYYEILQATNRFDESNLLGRGSIGFVYKGVFSGELMAFKVFNLELEAMSTSFDVECEIMRNLRHRNLIKIISSCSNADFKCLIMEFMPNGSLEKWLYSHNYVLDFLQRLNVMIDVAFALEYLHHGSSTPVVHCDLKPNNILLDEDMIACVSDFGISKLLKEGQSKAYTKTLTSIGYIAPEYGLEGIVSRKGDVYSYGIMLLEVFTRKKPIDDMFVAGLSLKSWVNASMPHVITQVMDSNLLQGQGQHSDDIIMSVSSIFELALNCCIDLPEARINMTDVALSLNNIKTTFLERRRTLRCIHHNIGAVATSMASGA